MQHDFLKILESPNGVEPSYYPWQGYTLPLCYGDIDYG